MVSQFDPLFLTLLDLGVVTLEFLFVLETQNVLLQPVQVALLYFLLFDDLIEVDFDVKKRVHIGDVNKTSCSHLCMKYLYACVHMHACTKFLVHEFKIFFTDAELITYPAERTGFFWPFFY